MAQDSLTETPVISSSSITTQSKPDPSLSRTVSLSRLNAQAPEFVPNRPTPRPDLQPPPPPPVSGMLHVYSPPPPPLQGRRVPVPSQVVNHHHHYNQNHHHYRSPHQYHASSSDQLSQLEPDHTPSSKNKHTDQADQKILKQEAQAPNIAKETGEVKRAELSGAEWNIVSIPLFEYFSTEWNKVSIPLFPKWMEWNIS
ncbi:hypothetical protein L195_g020624 [Trifolium pratense]|uniref:Uncharacterized protein n=1 Tax=Trifolium pratense TaxID=57577 RepID=A0A2K3N2W4_TRIPR|nr:hypothetical protein L195_g020624 [Trifolium pratense]